MAGNGLLFDWVHVAYHEQAEFTETYGFSGSQQMVNLEGILIRPDNQESDTLAIFMHPSSTLQLLPMPQQLARLGMHVLCGGSRYARNDTACILEKVVLDLGAYIRYAKDELNYQKIVLHGWSGGGSLALFYQSQAEQPTITQTPAGDPIGLTSAELAPADAVIFQAAHISRARYLLEVIDPSVEDEGNPTLRTPHLNIYDPDNINQPPYSESFLSEFRAAQLDRVRRITKWVHAELKQLRSNPGGEIERGFVTHRTMADPRFLDPTIEPNDRQIGHCYLGNPETVNNGPVGLARFSTLRSWLSQWSVDDTNADGVESVKKISVPLLVIENTADDAVSHTHPETIFSAATTDDKIYCQIKNATHYYQNQPTALAEANSTVFDWLEDRGLL